MNPVGSSNYNIPMPLASSSLSYYVFKSNRIMCERHFLFLLFYNDNIKLYHFPPLILFPLDLLFRQKVNLIRIVHKRSEFNVCIVIVIVIVILFVFVRLLVGYFD